MKTAAIAVVMLLAGYLLGGWGPNGDLVRMQDELDQARAELKKKGSSGRSALKGVSHILDIPDESDVRAEPQEPGEAAAEEIPEVKVVEAEPEPASTNRPHRDRGSMKEHLDKAANAWAVRSELARNSFVEQVELDEERAMRFDVLVEAMNIRIGTTIEKFVGQVQEDDRIAGEEFGVRLMNEITETMVLTYDEMDRNLPEGWRGKAGEKFSLSSLIDPDVAMPLVELEGRMDFD